MQAHHYTLAIAALWLVTLALLPYLFRRATARAKAAGQAAAVLERDLYYTQRIEALNADLHRLNEERKEEQSKFIHSMSRRQALIEELEARVLSSTGLVVTHADHHLLRNSAETLALAFKTWSSMPGTEPWRGRATAQAHGLNSLATRISAELRLLPASPLADKTEEAA